MASLGAWPQSAHLLPFSGSPTVTIPVEPAACEALADDARRLIAAFNAAVPGTQPATPSLQGCGYCPFPPQCDPFWAACGADWQPNLLAVAGTVLDTFTTTGGDITLKLSSEAGNAGTEEVVIWNVSPHDHPGVTPARRGSRAAAVSLVADVDRGVFKVPPWGLLCVAEHALQEIAPDTSTA